MHVALNAQLLSSDESYRSAGVSTYSRHLLHELDDLAEAGTGTHFSAFTSVPDLPLHHVHLPPATIPHPHPVARIAWEQLMLPRLLRRHGVDLVHGLVNVVPLVGSTPSVVTVHDLSFVRFPNAFPRARRQYLTWLCRASVRKARHVIAVSEQTAADLMRYFALDSRKISVIHNGVDVRFSPAAVEQVDAFRLQKRLPARFWLYLGTLEPRKNLPRLIRTYATWYEQASAEERTIKLILAGGKGWFYDEIFAQVRALAMEEQILFPGFVPDDELPNWYRAAEAFIYPSLFEGFGLPVLEAMACGVPVICSRAASLLEIVDDSALTFDAEMDGADAEYPMRTSEEAAEIQLTTQRENKDVLLAHLSNIARNESLRADLAKSGLARAHHFSWRRTAQETLHVYRQAVQ